MHFPGNDETRQGAATKQDMKWIDDRSLHDATMRYAAERICLWRLCGRAACLKARTCKGDVRRCTGLMADWIDAIEEEKKRVRGNFAGLESEIKTFEQLRVYLAWRELLDRAVAGEKEDPRETERDRREVARLIENTCKTMDWEREEAARKEREEAERKEREEAERASLPSLPGPSRQSNCESLLDARNRSGHDEE